MYQKIVVWGNLGKAPELETTPTGKKVCKFSVATNEHIGGKDFTEWHNVVVWGDQAENCAKFLDKGRTVLVEGTLRSRKWQDKEGQTRYATDLVAQVVKFGPKPKGIGLDDPQPSLDDIPF